MHTQREQCPQFIKISDDTNELSVTFKVIKTESRRSDLIVFDTGKNMKRNEKEEKRAKSKGAMDHPRISRKFLHQHTEWIVNIVIIKCAVCDGVESERKCGTFKEPKHGKSMTKTCSCHKKSASDSEIIANL